MKIETSKGVLRLVNNNDAGLQKIIEDSEDWNNLSETKLYPENMPTEMTFTIEAEGKIIGEVVFSRIRWFNRKSEITIIIKKDFQGKGYGKESLKAAMDFAFNKMNLHRLEAEIYEFNKVSIKLMESLGFKKEGVLREAQFSNGKYWDIIRYGILRSEFNGLHS